MDDWNLNEKSANKWHYLQHLISDYFIKFSKDWSMMLGLHLVLVTLHKRFTISIEQDK